MTSPLTRSLTSGNGKPAPPRLRGRSSSFTAVMHLKKQHNQPPRPKDDSYTALHTSSPSYLMPPESIPASSLDSGSDYDDDDDDDDLEHTSRPAPSPQLKSSSKDLRIDPGVPLQQGRSPSTEPPPPLPSKQSGPTSAPLEKKISLQFKDKLHFARRSQSAKSHGFSLWKHHSSSSQAPKLYDDGKNLYPPPRQTTDTQRRDQYGFTQSTQWIAPEEYEAFDQTYAPIMARRSAKWRTLLEENHGEWPQPSSKFKRYVRKGIPPEFRANAWFHYSGAEIKMQDNPGVYRNCIKKAKDMGMDGNEYLDIIERDLHRTFPDNVQFKSKNRNSTTVAMPQEGDSPAIRSLRNMLYAFSVYAPSIGYCQSLNYIAGFLLLFMDEEHAFWTFVTLIQDILPANVYDVSMEGASIDQNILMMLLSERCPLIWQRVSSGRSFWDCEDPAGLGLPTSSLVTSHWFLTLFINILPTESVLRVWDCLFYEGKHTLMRVALTIFKLNEQAILSVTDPLEVFQVVQNMPKRMVDCHQLLDATYYKYGSMTRLSEQDLERRRDLIKRRRDERRKGNPAPKLQRGGVAGTLLYKAKEAKRFVERAKTVRHSKPPS
ncbi:TBC-domain-containing protein [Hesseltinella vesiculosa]|uniref:TBC-domain-containing protein n=1 Tax=Hesseltinella vesiculosa TaxID=101127 RepID=A0A1X2GJE9_9FUNG|nr:TBC-domain-containing protein [Hesseltinella vesiculosa]